MQLNPVHRQLPDPLAGRREDRVGQRRRQRRGTGLADATGRFGTLHQIHLDRRRLVDAQHAVVVEIALFDAAILEGDFVEERGREAKHDAAFHLRPHRVRVDHHTAVHGADHPCDAHLAALGNLDFGDLRDIAAKHELNRQAAALAFR